MEEIQDDDESQITDKKLMDFVSELLGESGGDITSVPGTDEELKMRFLELASEIVKHDDVTFSFPTGHDVSVICSQAALEAFPKERQYQSRLVLISNLGPMLKDLFDLTREKKYLNNAVNAARELWIKIPDNVKGRWVALENLLATLSLRYSEFRDLSDLNEILQRAQIVNDLADGRDLWASISEIVAQSHEWLYQRTGLLSEIDKAVEVTQRIVQTLSEVDCCFRATALSNLSRRVLHRSKHTNESSDVENAINYARIAVGLSRNSEDVRVRCLSSLSASLTNQYDRTRGENVICEAIDKAQEALDLPSQKGERTRAVWLDDLAAAYLSRYRREQDISDVNHAIQLAKEAIELTARWNSQRLVSLNLLLLALSKCFERSRDNGTFEEATKIAQDIGDVTSETHGDPILGFADLSLGWLLLCQFEITGSSEDLDKAIKTAERAISLITASNQAYASALSILGSSLVYLFKKTKTGANLERTIITLQRAVSLTPDSCIEKVIRLKNLAVALEMRYADSAMAATDDADKNEALDLFRKGSQNLYGLPVDRIECARRAISIYVKKECWEEARTLAGEIIMLVPLACRRYTSRKDQQQAVTQISDITSVAASLSLRAGMAEIALQQLEFGRGLILGYIIDDRSDLLVLRKDYEDLVRNYNSLRYQVDVDEIEDYRRASLPADLAKEWGEGACGQLVGELREVIARELAKERRESLAKIEDLGAKIRQLSGFERFQMSLGISDLKRLAIEGPILIVNISDISADAIILTPHQIKALRLSEQLLKKAPQYSAHTSTRMSVVAADRKATLKDQTPKGDIYSWLWKNCVRSILDELNKMGLRGSESGQLPRVWWIGSGMATSLPFHAAGIDFRPTSSENTLSRVVPSYTPTIKALAHSRSRASILARDDTQEDKSDSVLLVTMPTTVGQKQLPGVSNERAAIQRACKGVYNIKELQLPTAEDVLEALERSRIAHFACHGLSDPTNPYESHLLLHKNADGNEAVDKLTLLEISKLKAEKRLWIAFLSACSTAQVKASGFTDEGLHLASAFQMAGFVHVIGSLWSADDYACAHIAKGFYTELAKQSDREVTHSVVAEALRQAVMRLRAEPHIDPSSWAPFVHFGA